MKKHIFPITCMTIITVMFATSCTSTRKLTYLRGVDELNTNPQELVEDYEFRIKPDDRIQVTISCTEPSLLTPFQNNVVPGSNGNNGESSTGILVDKDGLIELPVIGKFQAAELTRSELANEIKRKLQENDYIKNPTVIVRFNNSRILVLGEVGSPGIKNITNERTTLLEAIGMAGDLTLNSKRRNVLVLREENGQRRSYRVDLTSSKNLLNSPVFYIQQNDLIYVQPNSSARIKSSPTYTYLSAGGAIIGAFSSVLSIIYILTK